MGVEIIIFFSPSFFSLFLLALLSPSLIMAFHNPTYKEKFSSARRSIAAAVEYPLHLIVEEKMSSDCAIEKIQKSSAEDTRLSYSRANGNLNTLTLVHTPTSEGAPEISTELRDAMTTVRRKENELGAIFVLFPLPRPSISTSSLPPVLSPTPLADEYLRANYTKISSYSFWRGETPSSTSDRIVRLARDLASTEKGGSFRLSLRARVDSNNARKLVLFISERTIYQAPEMWKALLPEPLLEFARTVGSDIFF